MSHLCHLRVTLLTDSRKLPVTLQWPFTINLSAKARWTQRLLLQQKLNPATVSHLSSLMNFHIARLPLQLTWEEGEKTKYAQEMPQSGDDSWGCSPEQEPPNCPQ